MGTLYSKVILIIKQSQYSLPSEASDMLAFLFQTVIEVFFLFCSFELLYCAIYCKCTSVFIKDHVLKGLPCAFEKFREKIRNECKEEVKKNLSM